MSTLNWGLVVVLWLVAWAANSWLSGLHLSAGWPSRLRDLIVPAVFGVTLLALWQVLVSGLNVPFVILPAPTDIAAKFASALPTLGADLMQTVVRAVIPGWIIGNLAGFLTAVICDRISFFRRGLLPVGNLFSALPLVGISPIMVSWFGPDWQSMVAVIAVMTFFPMLVNALAGLAAAGSLERDLMRSYGASHGQTLAKLRLPAALPFLFNAFKINATLALIGAIVAQFFATTTVGMGFRISTEAGRLALDMVWVEIVVAALVGSAFYALLIAIERAVTFWHPSFRAR